MFSPWHWRPHNLRIEFLIGPRKSRGRKPDRRPRLELLEERLTPATHTWNGGTDPVEGIKWSNPNNWQEHSTPFGDPDPFLVFPAGSVMNRVSQNDHSGSILISDIRFEGSGFAVTTQSPLPGTIRTVGNITANNTSGTNTITMDISLMPVGGAPTMHVVALAGAGTLVLSGTISNSSGTNGILKASPGTLMLSGTNSYTGATQINAGTVRLGANNVIRGTSAVTMPVSGARFEVGQFSDIIGSLSGATGNVVSLGTGSLAVGTNNTSTTFSGNIIDSGSLSKRGTGILTLAGNNSYSGPTTVTAGTLQAGSATGISAATDMTLTAPGQLNLNGNNVSVGSLTGTGNVTLGNKQLTVGFTNRSTTHGGVISGNGGMITKVGSGIWTLTRNNTYTGSTLISAGTLIVNGSQPASAVTVAADAALKGTGTTGPVTASGTVAPGVAGPGILHTGDSTHPGDVVLAKGSTLVVPLNGIKPSTEFSQLDVHGTVDLSQAPQLSLSLGFASVVGDTFDLVTSTDKISGNFADLPDQAVFRLNGMRFQISYSATSVTLKHIAEAADHFRIDTPLSVVSGSRFDITVTALDANNNIDTVYAGTVTFTTSDTGADVVLPKDYTFTTGDGADNGVHIFSNPGRGETTLVTAGKQMIGVSDGSITDSTVLTVTPGDADHFRLGAPLNTVAGAAFDITVTALDAHNNVDTNYSGRVSFASTDTGPGVVLPQDYTFTTGPGADNGVHIFTDTGLGETTLVTAGVQMIMVSQGSVSGSAAVTVIAGRANHFRVEAPSDPVSGSRFDITVAALDAHNNIDTTYSGTVTFASSDMAADVVLPATYAFTTGPGADNGLHVFANTGRGETTLITAGDQMIVVSDGSINGSITVTVMPGAVTHFRVDTPASAVSGSPFAITVTALDAHDNVVTSYVGTVTFTTSDTAAGVVLPEDYTFTTGPGADNGVHVFTDTGRGETTLITAAMQTITVADGAIRGSAAISMMPGAADHFRIDAPSNTISGTPFAITVTVLDAHNNVVTNYSGTVSFTSSDTGNGVVLPEDYTFTTGPGADNGVHRFTDTGRGETTLITEGDQTIMVSDGSINGSTTVNVTPGAFGPRGAGPTVLLPMSVPSFATFAVPTKASNPATGETVRPILPEDSVDLFFSVANLLDTTPLALFRETQDTSLAGVLWEPTLVQEGEVQA
jgi:autotransporter-associated beta strand protein